MYFQVPNCMQHSDDGNSFKTDSCDDLSFEDFAEETHYKHGRSKNGPAEG